MNQVVHPKARVLLCLLHLARVWMKKLGIIRLGGPVENALMHRSATYGFKRKVKRKAQWVFIDFIGLS